MATKNGVTYRQNLVASSMYGTKCPYAMNPKKVTVHETDNNASANNEVAYMIRNGNQTSFHVGIDEKEAVQGIPFNRNAWHAGDGGNGYGNRNTISFEICKNYDPNKGTTKISGAQLTAYNKAKANAVKVIAAVMIEQGINGIVDNVKTHQDWSGKLCPQKMLREGLWIPMRDQIIAEWCRLKTGNKPSGLKPNPKPLKDGKVGDTVKVYNTLYLTSTGGGASAKKRGKQGKIKRIVGNSKKYLIEDWGWAHPNDIQLVKRAESSTPAPPSKPWADVPVTGKWTADVTKVMQQVYGSGAVDGIISGQIKGSWNQNVVSARWGTGGSNLIRVFQMRLRDKGWYTGAIDGLLGPQTIKALQRALGTAQDGVISPVSSMVTAFQKALNANKLPF